MQQKSTRTTNRRFLIAPVWAAAPSRQSWARVGSQRVQGSPLSSDNACSNSASMPRFPTPYFITHCGGDAATSLPRLGAREPSSENHRANSAACEHRPFRARCAEPPREAPEVDGRRAFGACGKPASARRPTRVACGKPASATPIRISAPTQTRGGAPPTVRRKRGSDASSCIAVLLSVPSVGGQSPRARRNESISRPSESRKRWQGASDRACSLGELWARVTLHECAYPHH